MKKLVLFAIVMATVLFSLSSCEVKPNYKDSDSSLNYIWKEMYFGMKTQSFYTSTNINVGMNAYTDIVWKKERISLLYSNKEFVFEKEDDAWASITGGTDGSTCYKPISTEEIEIIKIVYNNF